MNPPEGSLDHLPNLRCLEECSKRDFQRARKFQPKAGFGHGISLGLLVFPMAHRGDHNQKGGMLSTPRETENEVPEGHIWRQLWNSDKYFKRYSEVKMVHIHRWAPVLCPRDSIYCIKFQTWPRGQLGLFNRNCSTAAAKPIPIQEALLHHLVWSSQWL